jgi:DNA-binding winged helix-turn-helix (wHTH) protein/tetratricopeptide (TPR) repeat protein
MPEAGSDVFCFGGFTLDLRRGSLRQGDEEIRLRPKSFTVLRHLVENAGRLVPKQELLDAVWPGVIASDESLARCISDVRLALGDAAQRIVRTVARRGYLLTAQVSLREDPPLRAAEPPVANAKPHQPDERRQITVMSCQIVGLMALSARIDPEDLRTVVAGCRRHCSLIAEKHHGHLAHHLGDHFVCYFGYPEAAEHDAEHAVRAGLALIDSEASLPTIGSADLRLRIGIASGVVIVSDQPVANGSLERTAIGGTPNLAERLRDQAEPGCLIIDDATRLLVGTLFDCRDLGSQAPAGLPGSVQAWHVLGASAVESRFEALRSAKLPLIGRDEEIELLMRRWLQAKLGHGSVVLISGEPGIGKSRIAQALQDNIKAETHIRLRLFCSPHYQDSALYPFISQLERAAAFTHKDTTEQKLGKLRVSLAPGTPDESQIALVAELLSLPSSAATLSLSPQRKREMLLETMLHQLTALTRTEPVLMIFEDTHWIDPTSGELLDLILAQAGKLAILVVVTFRPEFEHGWSGQSHVTTLTLNRLGGRDGIELVKQLANDANLSHDIVREIVERGDGVPLFLEELTKAVIEGGAHGKQAAAILSVSPSPNLAIPATLHASLIARLDRLGPIAKEVGQVGSVIGREFSYDLIEQVFQRPGGELQLGLTRLAEAGLLFLRGVAPQSSYQFKHALVQDTAYATLLRGRRQGLHASVAAVLETSFSDLIERQPELLAHHLTAAGDSERATDQWLKAGQRAAARSAHNEAIHHFDRGVSVLASLPEGIARDEQEIELQLARGLSLLTAEGLISADALQAYARARELAEQHGDTPRLFTAIHGLWTSAVGSGRVIAGRGYSDLLLQLTAGNAPEDLRLQAHHSAWTTCLFAGEPLAAREHSDIGRRLYNLDRHRSHRSLYGGHDPGVCAGYVGAQAYWLLGYPDKGSTIGAESLALAESIADPFSLELSLFFNVMLCLDRGEPELALQRLDAAENLVVSQRLGFVWEPLFLRGAALAAQKASDDAVACLRKGLASQLGARTFRPYALASLAEAMTQRGNHTEALAAVMEGLAAQRDQGQLQWNAELHRLRGVVLFSLNQLEEAQDALDEALYIARKQQAKAYELRAATSIARLWGESGRRVAALDLLAPVYNWFTEGFDTADLRDAKVLLNELT